MLEKVMVRIKKPGAFLSMFNPNSYRSKTRQNRISEHSSAMLEEFCHKDKARFVCGIFVGTPYKELNNVKTTNSQAPD